MKSRSWSQRIDYSLLLPVFFLVLTGLLSIYIAVGHDYPHRALNILVLQGIWILFGIIVAFVVMFFTKKFLWQMTPFLYVLGLVLMCLPLFYYSPDLVAATGAKNWVTVNGQTLFQPSEFMKLSYILMMAQQIVRFQERHSEASLVSDLALVAQLLAWTAPVLVLLYLQSDLGTSLVFLAIFVGLVLLSGISWRLILPVFGVTAVTFTVFMLIFLSPDGKTFLHELGIDTYQLNRISAWLDPFENAQTTTFQQAQSLIAIGSGGFLGQGFNTTNLQVPVRESDMIFTVIGEDFGFVGSLLVIGLYILLIYRMIRVTIASNNRFYTFISTGFIMMILFHVFENIGAATGILPLTGIPLPFISQGGSSIISNLIGVGLLLSMSYQNMQFQDKGDFGPRFRHRFIIEKVSEETT